MIVDLDSRLREVHALDPNDPEAMLAFRHPYVYEQDNRVRLFNDIVGMQAR